MTHNTSSVPSLFLEIDDSWQGALKEELSKPYIAELAIFVEQERQSPITVFPPENLVFTALNLTPFEKVKVVILGQDPYHGPKQAHGLCFSVPRGITVPPSLRNIFLELQNDLGINPPDHGCLLPWAAQGILLLNNTLTVRQKQAMSHHGRGWERFTDAIVTKLAEREDPIVFVLWGKKAQEKIHHIPALSSAKQHLVLMAAHPSPFSATSGFFGCRHFSQINAFLRNHGRKAIDWNL